MPSLIRRARQVAMAAGALALVASVALAGDDPIRADDRQRLAALDAAAGEALRQAFAAGTPTDLAALSDALSGVALPSEQALALLPGEWSCQMMKLGGGLPITVYQPFRCRADAAGGFEKLTGSQRTLGHVRAEDGRLVYFGTGFVAGETPTPYAALPDIPDPAASPQHLPEIGVVEVTAPGRARIILPLPYLESRLNILVLRR